MFLLSIRLKILTIFKFCSEFPQTQLVFLSLSSATPSLMTLKPPQHHLRQYVRSSLAWIFIESIRHRPSLYLVRIPFKRLVIRKVCPQTNLLHRRLNSFWSLQNESQNDIWSEVFHTTTTDSPHVRYQHIICIWTKFPLMNVMLFWPYNIPHCYVSTIKMEMD